MTQARLLWYCSMTHAIVGLISNLSAPYFGLLFVQLASTLQQVTCKFHLSIFFFFLVNQVYVYHWVFNSIIFIHIVIYWITSFYIYECEFCYRGPRRSCCVFTLFKLDLSCVFWLDCMSYFDCFLWLLRKLNCYIKLFEVLYVVGFKNPWS